MCHFRLAKRSKTGYNQEQERNKIGKIGKMTKSLEELLKKKLEKPASKKLYFQTNQAMIFKLLDAGATHAEILEAIEKDGVKMSLRYFSGLVSSAQAPATAPSVPQNTTGGKPANETKGDAKTISPEKAAYIAECEAIQNDKTINSKQRRELLVQAEERYSKTHTLRG